MNIDTPTPKVHHGRNIKRLREILGVKQEALAVDLKLSQQSVSDMEQKEIIDDAVLEKIAEALKIPLEAIKSFKEEAVVNIIANTVNNNDSASDSYNFNYQPTFTVDVDKLMKIYQEKQELYERMLKEKDEMLNKLLKK